MKSLDECLPFIFFVTFSSTSFIPQSVAERGRRKSAEQRFTTGMEGEDINQTHL